MERGGPGSDALVVVDVISDFRHEDGEDLARSFADVAPRLAEALASARASATPVIYVNDARGHWDGDRRALVARALAGRAPDAVAAVAPEDGDRVLYKPRYSAFDSTALALVLEELAVDRIVLAGTATEMCVAQTAIQAREHGLAVSVLRDACADIDPDDADIALAYLARVTGTFVVQTSAWTTETAA
jgi:nicotinamidase-related amidase